MRTRRIAIRCRRTGRSAAVAIGSTGPGLPADPLVPEMPPGHESLPMLELPPLYGVPSAGAPAQGDPRTAVPPDQASPGAPEPGDLSVPAYLADPDQGDAGRSGPGGSGGRGVVNPWRSNRGPDLTLADILARPGRHDPDWNRNPGWPAGVGWAHIAHTARGRSPRHARARRRLIRWRARRRAAAWTGIAVLATAAVMLVAELLR
jgi:hypothetical protein